MKNFFLSVSGLIFGLVALLHLVRFLAKWPVVGVGVWTLPMNASLWAALVAVLLALGCFVARNSKA